MVTVGLPDATDALERVFVANVTAERVTRIRRIRDDAAAPHDLGCAPDQPGLRVNRMDLKVLAQGG
jgi:hypothetical protein